MVDGSIYLLSRKVTGDQGESYMQNVTVFAANPDEAEALVNEQFTRLRRASNSRERPYLPTPAWRVDKVALDQHKLITADITS